MNKTQRLQKFYDTRPDWMLASYGEYYHVGANQTIFRVALNAYEPTRNDKVLDIACTVGGNARWLASLYGCKVWGIDRDREAIQTASDLAEIEKITPLCIFKSASADDLPFEDEFFDLVVSTDIFDEKEIRRVLKPRGRFILSTLITTPSETLESLADGLGMKLEWGMDVTDLALAFHRAKEAEAGLLQKAGKINMHDIVTLTNEHITPYSKGGRHLLMHLRRLG